MRLTARSALLVVSLFILANACAVAQSKCTCLPSPPGATVECKSEPIAICYYADGTCHGKCTQPPAPDRGLDYDLDFSAFFLGDILHKNISKKDLTDNPTTFEPILAQLIKSSATDAPTKVRYKDQQITVGVGISDDAKNLLNSAQRQLAP